MKIKPLLISVMSGAFALSAPMSAFAASLSYSANGWPCADIKSSYQTEQETEDGKEHTEDYKKYTEMCEKYSKGEISESEFNDFCSSSYVYNYDWENYVGDTYDSCFDLIETDEYIVNGSFPILILAPGWINATYKTDNDSYQNEDGMYILAGFTKDKKVTENKYIGDSINFTSKTDDLGTIYKDKEDSLKSIPGILETTFYRNGIGANVNDKTSIPASSDITLYAQYYNCVNYCDNFADVTYNFDSEDNMFNEDGSLNKDAASSTDNAIHYYRHVYIVDPDNRNYTIIDYTPLRAGYTFVGWNTVYDGSGTSYKTGDVITGDTVAIPVTFDNDKYGVAKSHTPGKCYTLYAQWTPNDNPNSDNGSSDPTTDDSSNSSDSEPDDPGTGKSEETPVINNNDSSNGSDNNPGTQIDTDIHTIPDIAIPTAVTIALIIAYITGALKYLWLLLLLLIRRKSKWHGILTDDKNTYIKIAAAKDEKETVQDVINRVTDSDKLFENLVAAGSFTYLPYGTKIDVAYIDADENEKMETLSAENEDEFYKFIDGKQEFVSATFYNGTAKFAFTINYHYTD